MSCAVFAARSMVYYRHVYYSDKLYNAFFMWSVAVGQSPFYSCHFAPWYLQLLIPIYLHGAIIVPENNHTPTMGVLIWTATHLDFSDCFFREFLWEILSALPIPPWNFQNNSFLRGCGCWLQFVWWGIFQTLTSFRVSVWLFYECMGKVCFFILRSVWFKK